MQPAGPSLLTQFIVHIGPHKTGTTYLQVVLDSLRSALNERGIHVPAIWNAAPGTPSHMQLVWAIREGNLTLLREQIQEIQARRYRCVVISCEALSRLDQQQIVSFRQLLDGAPTQIIYYVRRWPERLASLWQETVKFGFTDSFPEVLATELTKSTRSELFDTAMIDKFSAVFGADQVKIVCYSHLRDMNVDIASHFLANFLNLSDITFSVGATINQSLPIITTEMIRALNAIHLLHGGTKAPALRSWFLGIRKGSVPDLLQEAMRASVDTIRLDEAAPQLKLAAEDLLDRYAPSIVPPHWPGGLHQPRTIDATYVNQNYLLRPEAAQLLNEIYALYPR
jgi:hypothetical protein